MKLKIFDLFLQIIIMILFFCLFIKDGFILDLVISLFWLISIILCILDIQKERLKKLMDKFIDDLKNEIEYKEDDDED